MGRQVEALRQMLNFNDNGQLSGARDNYAGNGPDGGSMASEPKWKVLVYDSVGQAILAPIFSVKQLRDSGVTLHILIDSQRDPVPDVPAVYFCQPTDANLYRIGLDLEANLYGSYHFNFISPISRQKMEDLASKAIKANVVSQIERVFDQFVNFISLENEMFTLRKTTGSKDQSLSFHSLNRADTTDTQMEDILNQMVDGLFAVCVTLGTVPIIRCPKGNAAEAVAVKLDAKLRENLKDTRNSLFSSDGIQSGQFSFYRPLLVILDRNVDMATPMHHTWTYQALAHDVLNYSLNRVTLTEPGAEMGASAGKKKSRVCDLDSKDDFWVGNKGSPFPEVAERIQEELEDYKLKEDDINRMGADMGLVDGGANPAAAAAAMGGNLTENMSKLTSAVSSLPVLLEKKRLIDMHTTIATALLDQIKTRKLDMFFELEEKIMAKHASPFGSDRSLIQILEDQDAGTPEDKLRLFLIYFLCSGNNITDAEVDQYAKVLEECGCDLSSLKYLKRWKQLNNQLSNVSTTSATDMYTGGGTKTISMFSKLVAQSSQFVMEGVKNLVVKRHNLPVTRIVEELMEIKPGQHQDEYRYFDPKILRGQDNIPRAKNPFQDAIVFMVGGGNYIEYQNLMDYISSKNPSAQSLGATSMGYSAVNGASLAPQKRIIYGCSMLNNANQLLQQLAELGHNM